MSDDPGPNPETDDDDLDVQWIAHIVPEGGYPTPAAGDSTKPGDDWIGVDDPTGRDYEEVVAADGELDEDPSAEDGEEEF